LALRLRSGCLVRGGTTALAAASQPSTPVNFDVRRARADTHTHVFATAALSVGARARFTPPASLGRLRALHSALHTDRVVFVHPSVYGTDIPARSTG